MFIDLKPQKGDRFRKQIPVACSYAKAKHPELPIHQQFGVFILIDA
jgi:hypothetical protein